MGMLQGRDIMAEAFGGTKMAARKQKGPDMVPKVSPPCPTQTYPGTCFINLLGVSVYDKSGFMIAVKNKKSTGKVAKLPGPYHRSPEIMLIYGLLVTGKIC